MSGAGPAGGDAAVAVVRRAIEFAGSGRTGKAIALLRSGRDGALKHPAGQNVLGALLMQAAHPSVAAGVAEHSTYATDPFGRLLRTLTSSFDVVFGTRTEAEATIRRVNAIHRAVRGTRPDGKPYSALEPDALLWVHATLVDTALRMYHRFVAPLFEDGAVFVSSCESDSGGGFLEAYDVKRR